MSRLSRQFTRTLRARPAKKPSNRRTRLSIHTLEDRTVPTVFTVTNLNGDNSAGSLGAAINSANSQAGTDTINFDPTLFNGGPGTISLTAALPQITGSVTIQGPGANLLTVNGNNTYQVLNSVAPNLTLSGFTVTGGFTTGIGGGLEAQGAVIVDSMVFTGNSSQGNSFNSGSGGAISSTSAENALNLTVRNSTISGNTAEREGSAIYFYFDGVLTVENSTISGNQTTDATGGAYAGYKIGGAIYSYDNSQGVNFTFVNSTIAGNTSADAGAAINVNGRGTSVTGTITLINSTIAGNTANVTASGYGGGGISTNGFANLTIENSVITGNTAANGPDILSSATTTLSNSAVGSTSGFSPASGSTYLVGDPATLGLDTTLSANGGPTQTLAISQTSQLVDAGNNAFIPAGFNFDQRGFGYNRIFNGTVDIGAVEYQPVGLPLANASGPDVTTAGGTSYSLTVQYSDPTGTNNGIQTGTITGNAGTTISVTGPNGFLAPASLVSVTGPVNGQPQLATYSFTIPGGWAVADNGLYTININGGLILDRDGNAIGGGAIGSFLVHIGQTFTVTNANDSGTGSLRDAITQADASIGDDTIVFDPTFFSTPQTITLASGLPQFTAAGAGLTITGPGSAKLSIDGIGAFQVFNSAAPTLTMSGMTVENGLATNGGGLAISGGGRVTLDHMVFTGNTATYGSLVFGAGEGGAIDVAGDGNLLIVRNSTISGNSATNDGGGINLHYGNSDLAIYYSTLSGNQTTYSGTNAYKPYHGGGGLTIAGTPAGGAPLIVANSTIANNTSLGGGGGIWGNSFFGELLVVNSTVSGNTGTTGGTGAYGYATGGGGIGVFDIGASPVIGLVNSVLSGNIDAAGSPDIFTPGAVYAYSSLIGDVTGVTSANQHFDTVTTGLLGKDPMLGPLQDNGGPTRTMAPQVGSPLIDAGTNSFILGALNFDQRGLGRFFPTSGNVDIGAVEAQPAIPTVTVDPAQKSLTNNPNSIVFDVTFDQPVTGFDPSELAFSGTAPGTPVGAIAQVSPSTYTVTVTGITGEGTVILGVDAGTGTFGLNGSGMNNVASTGTATVTIDTTPPTETITLGAGQNLNTNAGPITFHVTFSEPVTGFTAADVQLSGTEPGTSILSVAPVGASQTDYTVTITGMAGGTQGTVIINIPANAPGLTDLAGNKNLASTNTANTVNFDAVPPTVTISPAAGQGNPGGGQSVSFLVSFDEPIQSFTTADLDFTAPGGTIASISGPAAGTNDYTVTLSPPTSGPVSLTIDNGAVLDLAGNANVGSNTSSITYVHSGSLVFSQPTYTANGQGGGTLTVTVNRSAGQDGPLSVDFSTADGTGANAAKAGTDYTATSGTLNWADQDTAAKTISIPILNFDELANGFKPNANFSVNLTNVSLADALGIPPVTTLSAPITIAEKAGLQFKQATFNTNEGAGTATITVSRIGELSGTVTVDYATSNGTATAGSDYTATSGTLTWNPGDTDLTFTVPITDDMLNEGKETINLTLSNPSANALLAAQSTATLVIAPSDGVTINGTDKVAKSTFTDADGDQVTISLGGKTGSLTYYLTNGTGGTSNGPLAEIDLAGTDPAKTTVTVTVKKPKGGTGDGRVQLGDVTGTGFKSFTAKTADLMGGGFNLTGYAGSITVGNVSNGADFELGGALPAKAKGTSITAGVIGDNTDINVTAPLAKLTAVAVGKDTIEAPSVGSIKVTGQKANAKKGIVGNPGDFDATLTISGTGVDPVKGKALGSLSVAGTVDHAVLTVHGNVGTVTVGAFNTSDLFVGYTGPVDGSGTFDANPYYLTGFNTKFTAHSFVNSYVISTAIKSVNLASVDTVNGGTKFGFDFRNVSLGGKPFGGVAKLSVKAPKLSYNAKTGGTQTLADDFQVKKL